LWSKALKEDRAMKPCPLVTVIVAASLLVAPSCVTPKGALPSAPQEEKDVARVAAPPPMLRALGYVGQAETAPATESYRRYDDGSFLLTATQPLSTFAIDVDTASYANVRRFLDSGALPPKDAVRIEELLNYFPYDLEPPAGAAPVVVHADVGTAPWAPAHGLVRIALKAKEIEQAGRPAANLVFLIDVSGSMDDPAKLPLLKRALRMAVENLDPRDRVAMVVYAGSEGLALPSTPATDAARIFAALDALEAGGSTNGGAGIQLAYRIARENFIKGGVNRVLLATDGDFNVGISSEGDLTRLVEDEAKSGVFLTVLGFGTGNLKDSTMEALADRGNGNYAYIDSLLEARKALVEEAGGTLVTLAKDVKIQVEFNPARIAGYRLIGYENRRLADRDFNDDTKDAGEMGAGHSVTALYEIVPAGVQVPGASVDPLKYRGTAHPSTAATDELLTVKVRYKDPDGDTSRLIDHVVNASDGVSAAHAADFNFAAAVVAFGMLLRDAPDKGSASWPMVRDLASRGLARDRGGWRRQLVDLAAKAETLSAQAAVTAEVR
jgi:Ca-activated chloride channel family protein